MSRAPLRMGLLMHSLNPRGGVVHTLELADALCELGHAVTVFAPATPGQTLFRDTRAALSLAPLQALPPQRDLASQVGARIEAMTGHLQRQPGLEGLDVLHAQDGITANALATLKEQGRIGGFTRTVHHLDGFSDPQLQQWQVRGVRSATRLFCVSRLWQQHLADDWGLPSECVSNGVNLQRHRPALDAAERQADREWAARLGLQSDGPVWLALGGVEERKNTVRLLQAFGRIAAQVPWAQLVIAGGASLLDHGEAAAQFQAVLRSQGMDATLDQPHAHRVRLLGPVPDAAMPALYRRATALAMPSLREGFGLVVLEALACGTPAVVSRVAPFTEHLAEHEVLWTDPLDADDIARALLRSLDPTVTAPVLAAAPALCQRFDWAASARHHAMLYRLESTHA